MTQWEYFSDIFQFKIKQYYILYHKNDVKSTSVMSWNFIGSFEDLLIMTCYNVPAPRNY